MKAKNLGLLAVALMGVSGVSLSNPITYDLSVANGWRESEALRGIPRTH
jgi:hypothetical protein